jgi:hypothetical protein
MELASGDVRFRTKSAMHRSRGQEWTMPAPVRGTGIELCSGDPPPPQRRTTNASRSTLGRPEVPDTTILTLWVPAVDQENW